MKEGTRHSRAPGGGFFPTQVTCTMFEKEDSPLIRRMQSALSESGLDNPILRVSVADNPVVEATKEGRGHIIRWMCWSIESFQEEVVPPEFVVLHDAITGDQLRHELPILLPGVTIVVDNDVDI